MEPLIKDFPDWIVDSDSDAGAGIIGTKALNLVRLRKLGFVVPACFFIPTFDAGRLTIKSVAEYRNAIDAFSERLPLRLPSVDGWAVRSSATVEDLPGESHAGRFATLFITSPGALGAAVQGVWDSASSAALGPESMGVVVQELIDADFAGVAFSADPTDPEGQSVVECVPGMAARLVDGEVTPWRMRPAQGAANLPEGFPRQALAEIDAGLQKLADAFGGAVDVEWAWHGGRLYWLQVRPLTGARYRPFEVPAAQRQELKGLWTRINHSIAPQAPLIASLNPGGYFDGPGWTSRLVNGFHYIQSAPDPHIELPESEFDRVLTQWDETERRFAELFAGRRCDLRELSASQLWQELQTRIALNREYFENYTDYEFLYIRKQMETAVATLIDTALGHAESPDLVLARLLGQLGTKTEAKQRQLAELARLHAAHPTGDVRETREWAQFIDSFGFESPTTHLYYLPTLEETPDVVIAMLELPAYSQTRGSAIGDWRETAEAVASKLDGGARDELWRKLLRLRRCVLRTEDDDYLLGLATKLVRETILAAGDRLAATGVLAGTSDVFYLTGSELEGALVAGNTQPLESLVGTRRDEFSANKQLSPPPLIINGRPVNPKTKRGSNVLTGTPASPGVASGTVVVLNDPFRSMSKPLPAHAVIVAPIVTPALAYSLVGCAALVTEAGGLASHGAIVARELGIPAVVGLKGAQSQLVTGMSVTVDGTQGEVVVLGRSDD